MVEVDVRAPVTGKCSHCRADRRLRFAGYATDGHENGTRPRAFNRSCATCGHIILVLGDAGDALGLVRVAIRDWKQTSGVELHQGGDPSSRFIDLDDLAGELTVALWQLYSVWEPSRLSFASYASGLLPRRIASYVRDAVGGENLYRHNGRKLVRVHPKAHATSVCVSLDGASAATGEERDGDGGGDRLARALGAVTTDFAGDRSTDLGRVLAARGGGRVED